MTDISERKLYYVKLKFGVIAISLQREKKLYNFKGKLIIKIYIKLIFNKFS